MNNEPVAWFYPNGSPDQCTTNKECAEMDPPWTPLYTHPVKELPTKEDEYWLMVEVLRAKVKEQQAEIEALKAKLTEAIDAEKDRRFE